jgi:membrane protease YdiL (CAAX protease family)
MGLVRARAECERVSVRARLYPQTQVARHQIYMKSATESNTLPPIVKQKTKVKKIMKSFGKIVDLVIVFVAIELVPYISAQLANFLNPIVQYYDKDGVFLWISFHHIFQLLLTTLVMKFYFGSKLTDWGFNLNESKKAPRIVALFVFYFMIIEVAGTLFFYILGGSKAPTFGYPQTFQNITGYYSFEAFLSGTCEEPLFRGFVITVLALSWKGKIKLGKTEFTTAGIIAAFLFAFAHISFSIFPFQIYQLYILQLIFAFGLGLLYAVTFQKTKSLLTPILLHNLSNVVAISMPYILLLF